MQNGWKPTLKYSPVNGVIIDWGVNGEPFCIGCLPEPNCAGPSPVEPPADCECAPELIVETVDTYDWFRWVPEIIVGIQEASEDMAASYARRAAIEFARGARVLQRKIVVRLQPNTYSYPLEPFEGESVQGVVRIESPQGLCQNESCRTGVNLGAVRVDVAKQELRIVPTRGSCGCHVNGRGTEHIIVTVWVAPTEDSCKHDVFLYDQYRREITLGARAAFIDEAHANGSYKTQRGYANSRGDALTYRRADTLRADFQRAIIKAKVKAVEEQELRISPPAPAFGSGCSRRRY
jgi:hypothetical protein